MQRKGLERFSQPRYCHACLKEIVPAGETVCRKCSDSLLDYLQEKGQEYDNMA